MIYFPGEPAEKQFVLYDLEQDPQELKNVFESRRGERAEWPEQLRALHRRSVERRQGGESSPEERDLLRALGYGGDGDDTE
jgi:hypothetical protein